MTEKTGVFICECGENIAGEIDIDKLCKKTGAKEGVDEVLKHKLLCSDDGKKFMEKEIREKNLTKAVVAACSPRQHEETFRTVLKNADLNPFLMQMANIREQCAWTVKDTEKATEKALSLINGAVKRVRHHKPFNVKEIEAKADAMVIGAGAAGIEAALTLAQKGRKVTLVEKRPYVGGQAALYEDVFPGMECSLCMLEPRLDSVLHNDRIEVLTCSEIEEILGFIGNFTVRIRKKPRSVEPSACFGCTDLCIGACPEKTENEYDMGLSERKAIYTPFKGAMPNVPLIDREKCRHFNGSDCSECSKACQFGAIDLNEKEEIIERKPGAIIIAAGFEEFDCSKIPQLGCKEIEDVYTGMEFERILNAQGPTEGKLLKKDGSAPESAVIIHCVGSRSEKYNNYCSKVCCLNSLKFSHMMKEKNNEMRIKHIYRDMTLPDKEGQKIFDEARENGIKFIRVEETNDIKIEKDLGGIKITPPNSDPIHTDIVILSASIQGNSSLKKLSEMLDFEITEGGFAEELHNRLSPVSTAVEGIYIAGCAQGPKNIPEAVSSACAAAGKILSRLLPGDKIKLEEVTAQIEEDLCSGCRTCIQLCPFKAISFNKEKNISEINEALCKGCGTCVSGCPSSASSSRLFTETQISSEISGLLEGSDE